MAVSGSEKTRIGGQIHGVGKKQTFTAKAATTVTATSRFNREFDRPFCRDLTRVIDTDE